MPCFTTEFGEYVEAEHLVPFEHSFDDMLIVTMAVILNDYCGMIIM